MGARRRQLEIKRTQVRAGKKLAEMRTGVEADWTDNPMSDRFWDRPCCDDGDGWGCDNHEPNGNRGEL